MNKDFLTEYIKIIVLQGVFIAMLIIFSTVVRFANFEVYTELSELYNDYFMSDISLSLVLEGE